MVFALLICLTATTVTGTALLAVEENAGPLAPWLGGGVALEDRMQEFTLFVAAARASADEDEEDDDHSGENDERNGDALEEVHEFLSNFTLLLICLHIAGVALASVVHKENLARAMVTGRKRLE